MSQPRAKRVRPAVKHQRPVRGGYKPTPEERARVIAEIRRRLILAGIIKSPPEGDAVEA